MKPGPSLNESKGAARLQKLNERRQHIEDTIHELQDKHFIIESEIAALARELGS